MADLRQVLGAAVKLLDEYGNDGRALRLAYDQELCKLSEFRGAIPDVGMLVTPSGSEGGRTSWAPAPKPSKVKYASQEIAAHHGECPLHYVLRIGKDNGGNVEAVRLAIEGIKLLAAAA